MKNNFIKVFLLLSVIFFYPLFSFAEDNNTTTIAPIAGGVCNYESIRGRCRIKSVEIKQVGGEEVGTNPYNVLEVIFAFIPEDTNVRQSVGWIEDFPKFAREEHKEWLDPNTDVKNLGIRKGADLACEYLIINNGTCTPKIFRFVDSK